MKRLKHWLPALAYMALIFALSSIRISAPIIRDVPFQDKGVHFIEYLVLGFLCAYATRRTWPRRHPARTILLGAFLAAAWGFSDELHQAFVPGRSADIVDFVADTLGSSTGALLYAIVEKVASRIRVAREAS